ncbi:MAG: Gfo/Idh/MocA family oxidoreductase [Deltaproteobacteria bacterium]|nr:Gfo/Idh/MocA family oxidoreductase [Deltaproteobacteria bacterium]
MCRVIIYGAGSIGNHLAHACRAKRWDVLMCDIDPEALKRTRENIYPSRYERWDPGIRLSRGDTISDENFDVASIGTPPDTHVSLAARVLENNPPKVLLIEKPLCTPSLEGIQRIVDLQRATGSFVAVGYNHTLTENTSCAALILAKNGIGDPITISARFREHWGGIFAAHPWLSGPQDTYLGFFERGGGASGEHSHAINIWQHFARCVGAGSIVEVSATMDMVATGTVNYDRICLINVKTDKGIVGDIVQDVVTQPAQKAARVQGEAGFLEWVVNLDGDQDAVRYCDGKGAVKEEIIRKSRPDDFKGEIDHIESILNGEDPADSPISLERGLETMMVIAAVHVSQRHERTVRINYEKGYRPESIELL